MLTVVAATRATARLPVSITPDSVIARDGSRNGDAAATGAATAGAHAGRGSAGPGGAGASRFGPRAWRIAESSHRSIDRPSRRPSASTTAVPTIGVSTAMSTGRGNSGPTVLTSPQTATPATAKMANCRAVNP
jgi:hypothetical protein